MIDLHVHVLPGVDDGAPSLAVVQAMLERASGFGFRTLVATPHLPARLTPAYRARVLAAYGEAQTAARELGLDVRLGFEVALAPDLPARLEAGEASTLAESTAILVDLPFAGWPHWTEATLFALQTSGYRPVLAHPERYPDVQRDPSCALRLAEHGVILQVTIASLAGLFGRGAQRIAELLLRRGAVALLATDAHAVDRRLTLVGDGLRRLRAREGNDAVTRLLEDGPAAILAGSALPARVPAPRRPVIGEPPRLLAGLFRRGPGGG